MFTWESCFDKLLTLTHAGLFIVVVVVPRPFAYLLALGPDLWACCLFTVGSQFILRGSPALRLTQVHPMRLAAEQRMLPLIEERLLLCYS